jgi:SAM-dependent methyltransferase
MIGNDSEYTKMYCAETNHWWYKILHLQTLKRIESHFSSQDLQIVDAGCGTGGLLNYLSQNGYFKASGIDISEQAISCCRMRGVNATRENVLNIDKIFKQTSLDVIICNDVLYYLSFGEKLDLLFKFHSLLKENGIIIMNNPSLKMFRGIHDVAIGIRKRVTKYSIESLAETTKFKVSDFRYWPFLLSPLILAVRLFQRIKILFFKNIEFKSDVSMQPFYINYILFLITKFELVVSRNFFLGSSCITTLVKQRRL